jgi:hypothetical protein
MVLAGMSECTRVPVLENVGASVLGHCELGVGVVVVVVVVVVRVMPVGILVYSSDTGSVPLWTSA